MEIAVWQILMVDDDRDDHFLVREMLSGARKKPYRIDWYPTYESGLDALRSNRYDAVLIDYDLGARNGIEFIQEAVCSGCQAPILLLTGRGNYDIDVEAMQAGAADYLNKNDLNAALLERSIRFAIERARSEAESRRQRELLRALFDRIPIMIIMYHPNLEMLEFNKEFVQLIGWDNEDARQPELNLMEKVYPDPNYRQEVTEFMQSLNEGWRDFDLTAKDGRIVTSSWTNFMLADDMQVSIGIDLTERIEAEQKLRQSQAYLQLTMEAAQIGLWDSDILGETLTLDSRCKALFGLSESEPVNITTLTQTVHPDDRVQTLARLKEFAARDELFDIEFRILRSDGSICWVLGRGRSTLSNSGQPKRLGGVILDITERKRREENNHFLVSLGNQVLSETDPDTVIQMICQQTGQHLGVDTCFISEEDWCTQETVIRGGYQGDGPSFNARCSMSIFPPPMRAPLQAGQKLILEDIASHPFIRADLATLLNIPGSMRSVVLLPRLFDGTLIGLFTSAAAQPRRWMKNELELLEAVASLAWLALDQARAQQNLKIAEERFRIAMQNVPAVVFTQDGDLRYTWMNKPHHNYAIEEVLGKRDDDLLDAISTEILLAPKRIVLQTGQSLRQEVTYRVGDQQVVFDLTLEPLKDSTGRVIGITGAALDLTDVRRLEAEKIEYAAQMEVQRRLIQQREMERMDIARDLHDGVLQEMTAVGFALAEAMSLDEKAARIERLQWIQHNLLNQVREIRAFCNDLRPPALAPFGLEKAIRSHAADFSLRYPNLEIKLDLQADQQSLPTDTRMALYRIYQEAMNNVARHARANQVTIYWSLDDHEVYLEIADNGVGYVIPYDWVAHARTGHLGLLGIRERVASIGGQVTLDSRPGHGTRVRVTAPRARPDGILTITNKR